MVEISAMVGIVVAIEIMTIFVEVIEEAMIGALVVVFAAMVIVNFVAVIVGNLLDQ